MAAAIASEPASTPKPTPKRASKAATKAKTSGAAQQTSWVQVQAVEEVSCIRLVEFYSLHSAIMTLQGYIISNHNAKYIQNNEVQELVSCRFMFYKRVG